MRRALPPYACAFAAAVTLASAASACASKEPTGQPLPALSTITKAGGDGQTGPAGVALPVQLSVQVKDSTGHGLAGISVSWAVTAGGGSLSGGSTDASGLAAATWTLGRVVGANGARASVTGLAPITFQGTGVAGPAASVARQAGDGQSAAVGSAVATAPAVVVKDAFGNAKAGVTVSFAVASGGGSVGGATQTTDSRGIAAVGSWTLGGTAGTNTLAATVTGSGIAGNPLTFTATATSGGGGGGGGGTLLLSESFADANLGARGWYDLPSGGITSVTTAQHAPGSTASLEMDYTPGSNTPVPAVATRHQFTPSSSVYLRYWVKYDTNWVGSGLPYHPHEFYFFTTDDAQYVSPAANHLTIYVEHNWHSSAPAGGYASVNTQDATNIDASNVGKNLAGVTENRAVSGCNGVPDSTAWSLVTCYQSGSQWENERSLSSAGPVFLPAAGAGYKSNWNLVEVYIQLNSIVNGIGQQDGVIQYWFDSTLVMDKHNVLLRTGAHPTMQFNQIFIGPYMETVPVAERAWIDGLVVMTARP